MEVIHLLLPALLLKNKDISQKVFCCLLTQHGISFSTHGVVEGPDAFDFLSSKKATAVFRDGRVVVHRVHGSHWQPLGDSDEF